MSKLTLYQRQRSKIKNGTITQLHQLIGDCHGHREYLPVLKPESQSIKLRGGTILLNFLVSQESRVCRLNIDLRFCNRIVFLCQLAVSFHQGALRVIIQSRLNLLTAFCTPNLKTTDHCVSNLNLVNRVPSVNQSSLILVALQYSDSIRVLNCLSFNFLVVTGDGEYTCHDQNHYGHDVN